MSKEVLYQCDCGFHKWRLRKGARFSKTSEAYCPKCERYTTFAKCSPTQTRAYPHVYSRPTMLAPDKGQAVVVKDNPGSAPCG